jgi:putative transcriptional regulator
MTPDPYRDDAAAYAAGGLEEAERSAFETHLSGCPGCAAELADHARVLVALGQDQGVPAARLDPVLRAQTLELAQAPPLPIDLSAYKWDEVCPGVRVHVVKDDPVAGLRVCLIWADPGAVHPAHRHLGDEVILVLKGRIKDERGSYGPGEICRSRTGSVHSEEALPGEECLCYVLYHGELEPVGA